MNIKALLAISPALIAGALTIGFPLKGQSVLVDIIRRDSLNIKYKDIFKHHEKYHLQVIYTRVTRDKNRHVILKKYFLEQPTRNYYYPASLVKLPLAALALEKLNKLRIPNLNRDTRLYIDSSHRCERKESYDSTSLSGYPSIAQYIKRMLLISDNNAYSRIYEFLTPAYINKRLHEMGYTDAMINQRFKQGCDSTENRYTNGFTFLSNDSVIVYRQPPAHNTGNIRNHAEHTTIGLGYQEGDDVLPPKNFKRNNYIPFEDENEVLLSLIYPRAVNPARKFKLTAGDYAFLKKYMGMLPRESSHPTYDPSEYPDNYKKYIYFGTTPDIEDTSIRSYNIVGQAYGFLADCSYIKDTKTGVEFFLSILIYVNKKGILNNGEYEYRSIGMPFMSDMGHAIYDYELKRKKRKP